MDPFPRWSDTPLQGVHAHLVLNVAQARQAEITVLAKNKEVGALCVPLAVPIAALKLSGVG